LPPARTGIADYAAALLRAFHAAGYEAKPNAYGDVNLYQLGNNEQHAAIYRRAMERPGVATLHDALLQHLFLRTLSEDDYVSEFVFNYSHWHSDLARDLYRNPSGLRPELYRYPMLRRIAETSLSIVVHNSAAADIVRRHAPEASITVIPHLFEPPARLDLLDAMEFRQRIGLPACAFVFGLFGYLRESKRVTTVLSTFGQVHAMQPDTRLLVAGEFVSTDLPLAAEALLEQPGVIRMGHLPERDFWLAASATDVCVNLRDPACGETSGVAIRFMGLGKCVILSAVPENAAFPESSCVRIDTGLAEGPMLLDMMVALARFPQMARDVGSSAARHIARFHAPETVAARYWQVLESTCAPRAESQASAR
jgi:glycosyltransferase involved in cell wall biosynthesis